MKRDWTANKYTLRSVTITDGFQGVYAVPATEDPNGQLCRVATALDAIGVADVEQIHYWQENERSLVQSETLKRFTHVVGLTLCDGSWAIEDEDERYAGMIRNGESPAKAITNLTADMIARLVDFQAETESPDMPPAASQSADQDIAL